MKTTLPEFTKRVLIVFLFACLILTPIMADTGLSGTITKDSTLSLAGSPYLVASLTIRTGATLTIVSGVTVKFNDNGYMYINGKMNATGVTFTSASTSPTPGKWGYIQIGSSADSASVTLTDCLIRYAQQLVVYRGTATLNNTDISDVYNNGISVETKGILNMTGGTISSTSTNARNSYDGVSASSNSRATLSGVTIQNFNYGVGLDTKSTVSLSNMNIRSCEYPVAYNDYAYLSVGGTNIFSSNDQNAVRMNFSSLSTSMTIPYINIPYLFSSFTIQSAGTLTVTSRNILKFTGPELTVNGTLIANAAVGENIYFTSFRDDNLGGDTNNDGTTTAPKASDWEGVYFHPTSVDANCLLRRCNIRYSGSGEQGGICTYNASPTIDSCDISNNYIGVYMQGTSNPLLTNNTIGSSVMTPLAMSFEANPVMSNNKLSFSDNAYDAIGIIGGTMLANGTLKVRKFTDVPNITYLLLAEITVPTGVTLTINKGITIKSYSSDWYYHRIIVNGTLLADATADSMINITSARDDNYGYPADCNKDGTITSPAVADWGGIIFNPGSTGVMDYCRIKYAKISNYSFSSCNVTEWVNNAAIGLIDASPTFTNCEFKDLYHAISCYRSASPTLTNISMANILYTPINLSGPSNPVISGITYTNVGWQALGLLGGNVCLNGTIKKRDVAGYTNITYVLLSDMLINSGTYVNVESGVVIKCAQGYNNFDGRNIFVDGGFKIDGTASQKVIFTSIKDDNAGNPYDTNGDGNATTPAADDWGSIKFRSTSDDAYCKINNALIKYAGYTDEGGVTFENSNGKLSNSTITNSANYGVYCNGNSASVVDSVIIQNCSLDPIAMSLTSNPVLSNITFVSNFSQAIKIIEGTLSTIAILAPRNVAGITNIAYVVDKLTISSNAKLTVLPGVVVKFRGDLWPYYANITVNGNLIANGTSTQKIYFTSFKDDSKGGDSNNNGNTNAPEKGDWGQDYYWYQPYGGIMFMNNSTVADTVNSLKYCEISYPTTGIRIENAHATIDHCTIQLCENFAASVIGSANPTISNCAFYNINYSPIELSMFSAPVFTDCSALNVGYMALTVVPETFSKTATIPVRDFAGYTNIGYLMEGPCTINSGCTITIPAGLVFKSVPNINSGSIGYGSGSSNIANGFIVNGRLNIEGTTTNPVVFTHANDDTYGNPKDMNQNGSASKAPTTNWTGNWITFNDISDDLSFIKNAIFKYGNMGVTTLSASPEIKGARFEQLYDGIDMSGVSAPKIDSCTFHNLQYYPIQISLVSYPSSTVGNLISGSTYKVIKVRDEILTQDVTLPKRDFGGKTNIPYYFEDYQIGTSASLAIKPGVICKFRKHYSWETAGLSVSRGLTALGGASKDSTIVFTSILDDFYGGDSNSDSTDTKPSFDNWSGLIFLDQALDPSCILKNCIIRYADKGVNTTSASPSFEQCNFKINNYGAYVTAASNPVFVKCDFSENRYYAIDNVGKSFVINATNGWWGSNAGPIQSDADTDDELVKEQEYVTTGVNYTPWRTTGTLNPITGDVSLNGLVQAYDASMVLKNVVGSLTFSDVQSRVADVSGSSGITAFDASLILQYVVGASAYFPVNKIPQSNQAASVVNASLMIGNASVKTNDEFSLPVTAVNVNGLYGTDIRIRFNPADLEVVDVESPMSSLQMSFNVDKVSGLISIAMAGATSITGSGVLANLKFKVIASQSVMTDIHVEQFLINEQDYTDYANTGSVSIVEYTTDVPIQSETRKQGMDALYPNPFNGEATLVYHLDDKSKWINIELFNIFGQKVAILTSRSEAEGDYSIQISNKDYPLQSGTYFIRMKTANFTQTQKFQVGK